LCLPVDHATARVRLPREGLPAGTALLRALVPVVIIFSIWDLVGIYPHHWSYNPQFVTGIQLPFGLPLEELVFFVVVRICGLLTYEAVGNMIEGRHKAER